MLQNYSFSVADRFVKYVRVDTQSDPTSDKFPSTEKQKDLARILVQELQELGIQDAEMDGFGYVYATIPANSTKKTPVICFCAHMDTSPDCSGSGVQPLVHRNYDGSPITLPLDPDVVLHKEDYPYLSEKIGEDLITASGNTLLGADDKSGIAVIMDLVQYLQQHPEVRHGTVKILFTPDEEIGRGVDHVDLGKLGADFAYTLDAGELGSYEDETFSAHALTVTIFGKSAHPGYGKDKLVNALKVAAAFLETLPKDEFSPETTEGRFGFVHPVRMEGLAEKVTLEFIIRDFVTAKLAGYEQYLLDRLETVLKRYPGARAEHQVREQYLNMKEVVSQFPQIGNNAAQAMERAGVEVKISSARGGTDGSRLSFMGLPCPNLFTGEMAFHGKTEFVSIQDMQKSVTTLVHLVQIWEENA